MAKPLSWLADRWKLVVPALLILVCSMLAASRPTWLNLTGILIGTIWLVVSLRGQMDGTPASLRAGGLTPGMQLEMNRALAEKKNTASASDLPQRDSAPLEAPPSWHSGSDSPSAGAQKAGTPA